MMRALAFAAVFLAGCAALTGLASYEIGDEMAQIEAGPSETGAPVPTVTSTGTTPIPTPQPEASPTGDDDDDDAGTTPVVDAAPDVEVDADPGDAAADACAEGKNAYCPAKATCNVNATCVDCAGTRVCWDCAGGRKQAVCVPTSTPCSSAVTLCSCTGGLDCPGIAVATFSNYPVCANNQCKPCGDPGTDGVLCVAFIGGTCKQSTGKCNNN